MGRYGVLFEFANRGDTCTLDGYPQIFGMTDAGTWESVTAVQTTNTYIPAPPPTGPLARGDAAGSPRW